MILFVREPCIPLLTSHSILRGQTALHQAAQNRRRTVCCMLVAAGASLTIRDLQGNTPRALAQHADDQELAAYLESKCQLLGMNTTLAEGESQAPMPCHTSYSHSLRGTRQHAFSKRLRVERLI